MKIIKTIPVKDLKIDETYHIRNGFSKYLDELWMNNVVLKNIIKRK